MGRFFCQIIRHCERLFSPAGSFSRVASSPVHILPGIIQALTEDAADDKEHAEDQQADGGTGPQDDDELELGYHGFLPNASSLVVVLTAPVSQS